MSEPAILVKDLSKRYRIGSREPYQTLRNAITVSVAAAFRRLSSSALASPNGNAHQESDPAFIWALKNVSFEVQSGDVVGIIGPNGGGKSTLLKILSRITMPTEGHAEIRGRVGSLLEVGTGFNPELTGRENIYLNGTMLGMRRSEIERKFDEIVAFAEVERFLDTPVKRYSSGMYMRLAFAVAAHLEPEILLVDEVLAVGDIAFQKKCLGKIGEVAKDGRTVLFVSHNMVAIQSLCSRVIWLNQGKVMAEGKTAQVVFQYLKTSFSSLTEQVWANQTTAPGNDQVRLRRVCVRPADSSPSDPITMRTPIRMEFEFWNLVQGADIYLYFQLINNQGIVAFASSPIDGSGWNARPSPMGLFSTQCSIPADLLIAGQYRVLLSVVKDNYYEVYQLDDALVFEVQDAADLRSGWYGEMVGVVRPLLEWTTELIESQSPIELSEPVDSISRER